MPRLEGKSVTKNIDSRTYLAYINENTLYIEPSWEYVDPPNIYTHPLDGGALISHPSVWGAKKKQGPNQTTNIALFLNLWLSIIDSFQVQNHIYMIEQKTRYISFKSWNIFDLFETPLKHPWYTLKTSLIQPWNFLETPLKVLWNTPYLLWNLHETPLKILQNNLQSSLKHPWIETHKIQLWNYFETFL